MCLTDVSWLAAISFATAFRTRTAGELSSVAPWDGAAATWTQVATTSAITNRTRQKLGREPVRGQFIFLRSTVDSLPSGIAPVLYRAAGSDQPPNPAN